MNERIYLSSPDVGELEEQAVLGAIRSGWIAPLGPDVDAFETELAARVGVGHAVALSSGTAALHLGLLGLGVGAGDIVVTSTMTFAATANAIRYVGAEPCFIDSERDTGNIDPELLRSALADLRRRNAPVRAIIPVDVLGKAVNYTAILEIAEEFDVPVLSDAAESLGATHQGSPAGSFGAASAVSFNGNKIMTTSGGGMLLTNDARLAEHTRYLATQARQPVAHYEHTDIGFNYRLSNLLAALGRAQLQRLDGMISKRRALRQRYVEFFADVQGIEVFGGDGREDNCWLSSIIIDETHAEVAPETLHSTLTALNIESRPLWKPMHLQPIFREFRAYENGTSQRLFERGLTLPSGSVLGATQQQRVFEGLSQALGKRT